MNLKEICLRLYKVSAETQVMEHCDGGELLKAGGEYEGQYEGRYGVGIPSEVWFGMVWHDQIGCTELDRGNICRLWEKGVDKEMHYQSVGQQHTQLR